MDDRRFDDLAKTIARGSTRRHFVNSLVLAVGALFGKTSAPRSARAQYDCSFGQESCFGSCVNTSSDNYNCGGCGNVCPALAECRGGQCSCTYFGVDTICAGTCVDTSSDSSNCGGCGNVCPALAECRGGQCSCTYFGVDTICAGTCVDTSSDSSNCGGCGNVCPGDTRCIAGSCQDRRPPAPTATITADREAYVDVTPDSLRVAPGGSALFFIQPIFRGDWGDELPEYTIEISLPSGMSIRNDVVCGPRQSTIPNRTTCEVEVNQRRSGSTVTARPGYSRGNTKGLYVTVEVDQDVAVGTRLEMDVSLDVPGAVSNRAQDEVSISVLVVRALELRSQDDDGVISGLLEIRSGYSRGDRMCSTDAIARGTELALFEWGGSEILAKTTLAAGRLRDAADGTDREVCIFDFEFEGVPDFSVYTVSYVPVGDTVPCQSCNLGLITPSDTAEQIIILGAGTSD